MGGHHLWRLLHGPRVRFSGLLGQDRRLRPWAPVAHSSLRLSNTQSDTSETARALDCFFAAAGGPLRCCCCEQTSELWPSTPAPIDRRAHRSGHGTGGPPRGLPSHSSLPTVLPNACARTSRLSWPSTITYHLSRSRGGRSCHSTILLSVLSLGNFLIEAACGTASPGLVGARFAALQLLQGHPYIASR